jgi:apolipoprotein N-acyltransferase
LKLLRAFWPAPLVAGALLWASFPPLDQGWLQPLGWALLFLSMRLRRGERAGRQAFVAALVLFVPGLSWIRPLVWPLWLVVALWCAAWEALFGWASGKLFRGRDPVPVAWVVALPAAHLLIDMLRTVVLTGFPWFLPGYAGWRIPMLIGSADLLGVHGATFVLLATGAAAAEVAARRVERRGASLRPLGVPLVLWAACAAWAFGKPRLEERPGPTVLVLQPNISQLLKEDAVRQGRQPVTTESIWHAQEDLAAKGLKAARAANRTVDCVIWPETMVPAAAWRPLEPGQPLVTLVLGRDGVAHSTEEHGRRIAAAAAGAESLAGIASGERLPGEKRAREFNTVVLLDSGGRVRGFQDKQHLTPGGEYVPLRDLIPFRESLERYLEQMAGFLPNLQPGDGPHVLPLRGGGKAGVLICYESAFPEVVRRMVNEGATLLVNCSNYGWFAGTAEMDQALAIDAFRAAELRRSLVVASNNGVDAVLGPDGRVRGEITRADEPAWLLGDVPLCTSVSPFAVIGEWGAWVLGAIGAVFALAASRPAKAAGP